MKWVTKDYKGNQKVWYSGDVIEKIYNYAKVYICANCTTDSKCVQKNSKCGYKQIIDEIESEDQMNCREGCKYYKFYMTQYCTKQNRQIFNTKAECPYYKKSLFWKFIELTTPKMPENLISENCKKG